MMNFLRMCSCALFVEEPLRDLVITHILLPKVLVVMSAIRQLL